jgi:hypothetical protein
MGHAVAYSVEALCYKPDVSGSSHDLVDFFFYFTESFQPHYSSGVDTASNRNGYQE